MVDFNVCPHCSDEGLQIDHLGATCPNVPAALEGKDPTRSAPAQPDALDGYNDIFGAWWDGLGYKMPDAEANDRYYARLGWAAALAAPKAPAPSQPQADAGGPT